MEESYESRTPPSHSPIFDRDTVNGLSNIEDIQSAVWVLGDRYFSYGVKPEYFPPFRESFLWAFEHHLGDGFTPELQSAWVEALSPRVK